MRSTSPVCGRRGAARCGNARRRADQNARAFCKRDSILGRTIGNPPSHALMKSARNQSTSNIPKKNKERNFKKGTTKHLAFFSPKKKNSKSKAKN